MTRLMTIFVILGEHTQIILRQKLVDHSGAITIGTVKPLERLRNPNTRTIRTMRTASLDMSLHTRNTMRQLALVSANHIGNRINRRQKLIELLLGDKIVLGTRIRYQLMLVHGLINLQKRFRLQTLRRKQCRQ